MKANSDKSKQSNKATRRVLAGVLCGASVLSLVLSLVMPPISQAIANDAQTVSTEETVMGGGSSTESTDVDNTTGRDAENQNSDETEGDEAGDDAQLGGQSEEEQQNEGTTTSDGETGVTAAENEQAETASDEMIDSASMLKDKLENAKGTANFQLTKDIDTSTIIQLGQKDSKITLDLNGHKIKHTSSNQPLFNITGGATLTVKDGQQAAAKEIPANQENKCGNLASMEYGDSNIPTKLTYYVTESVASGTVTNETLKAYEADIKGAIVACSDTKAAGLRLVNLFNGGHFNLESGVLTQKKDGQIGNLIYAENGSTVNMSGGYVCGAFGSGDGAGIMVSNEKGVASTLKLTGGVIAGNSANSGGGVYARYSEVAITNGIISGNSTLGAGLGGGIMAVGGIVTVSGGYITNNRMAKSCGHDGNGDHGGAGLAANNGAHVTISDGQITGNYSEEAGGGVYVTDVGRQDWSRKDTAWLNITGGTIASNVSFRSEGAGIRVGQMVDAMINGTPDSNGTPGRKVYITNNYCMSRFDWGGGGIFVQGNSDQGKEYTAGRLFIYNSYISANEAGGYGGGVAVCPTGKTLVTNTKGTAIFGNKSAGAEYDNDDHNSKPYDKDNNSGNDVTPHLSGGGSGKNQDKDAYRSKVFRDRGHADFFLAAAAGHQEPLAAVIGKMLGDGDAKYSGSKECSDTKELSEPIDIPANGGVKIYRSVGLSSAVTAGSAEANKAQEAAGTFITGNYSWDHGGGIMSNGDLYLGVPADTYVYPSLKLKATKKLEGRKLNDGEFSFTVYRKDSDDPLAGTTAGTTFNRDVCTEVGTAANDAEGSITFDLGEQFASSGAGNEITYYLVEDPGGDSGITYDSSVYKIVVTAEDTKTLLMSVPSKENSSQLKDLYIHNYTIKNVGVTKYEFRESSGKWENVKARSKVQKSGDYYPIICEGDSTTFTNKFTPYDSKGSWTPMATKVVEGGEMKEFTLQLATDTDFTDIVSSKSTTADGDKSQTLSFDKIDYKLDQLDQLASGPTGRGASKTFTYYVREKDDGSLFSHYTYDKSVYQITVNATDDSNHHIDVTATYKQIQDRDGNEVTTDTPHDLTGKSTPTFTNTYSTSLPLSGMSGVTLTYLAGAAVLCAAAAWMHIRRKANAKGGERRE
ncbi:MULTISPECIES: Spy0128 family protein [Collinsella]|uniref:Spy0128 family protein n=1 Tax=Collinsella TaxID=102106 RepID=UPI000E493B0F|nr:MULTISPECIES: FctA domain-containing protein [Collinsella]RHD35823.1 hypothetical protein DW796_04435 [Collinsella sp. AM31-2AC]